VKTEADSNDVTECSHDDKWPTVGMLFHSFICFCFDVFSLWWPILCWCAVKKLLTYSLTASIRKLTTPSRTQPHHITLLSVTVKVRWKPAQHSTYLWSGSANWWWWRNIWSSFSIQNKCLVQNSMIFKYVVVYIDTENDVSIFV